MNLKQGFSRLLILLLPVISLAQTNNTSLEVYGFILTDGGYNFNSIHPDWYDVMRPTKLPRYKNEFGPSGNYFISVRQTRLGVRTRTQTALGEFKTQIDFDLFGFGKDAGQTTFHLVNGFAQLGKVIAGQTPSVFMDTEVFPVTLDYWGPSSRVFILNIQLRYTPVDNAKQRFAVSLERPAATADGSDVSNTVDISNVKPRFPLPNLATHYRRNFSWGHMQVAALVKYLQWKDVSPAAGQDLSGDDIGWGLTASTVINAGARLKFKLQGEYGAGFQNYMADPSPDVALQSNVGSSVAPAMGKALPAWGFLSFIEIAWTGKLKSSAGYSMINIENADLQSGDAFRKGQYALINLRSYPVDNVMIGIEYQHGRRDNFNDGFRSVGNKIQFAFRFSFAGGTEKK